MFGGSGFDLVDWLSFDVRRIGGIAGLLSSLSAEACATEGDYG
jgi:hypothetical protein